MVRESSALSRISSSSASTSIGSIGGWRAELEVTDDVIETVSDAEADVEGITDSDMFS